MRSSQPRADQLKGKAMHITLEDVLVKHDQDVLEHLDRQVTVPIVGFGRQGDVIVIPDEIAPVKSAAVTPVPATGHPVVRGENGGNTHLLVADGDVRFDQREASATRLILGILSVAKDAVAYLIHPEHGAIGFGPGDYTISRQREQADELRLVQD